jgi:glycosyltransferase involved in cell wall biosynthesis
VTGFRSADLGTAAGSQSGAPGSNGRRLLCVYQHAPTPGAPGIYRHRLLLSRLVARGWSVDLVSTPLNYMTGELPEAYRGRLVAHETIDGIRHHWVWASRSIHSSKRGRIANYVTFAAAALAQSSLLRRPDVVLVSSPPLPVAGLGSALGLRYRVPWVLEVRDIWPESAAAVGWLSPSSRIYGAAERFAWRQTSSASGVVVPTHGLVAAVLRHGARLVRVVPGAVMDAAPDDAQRDRSRAELRVAPDTCLFVYTGAVGVANGLDMLLDAVALLPAEVPALVVVAGNGSALAEIEQRVARERLDRVRLLGAVTKERVRDLLAAADVCLHLLRPDPVFSSALPTKVLEYLGAHRPFVTTTAGLPERIAIASEGAFAPTAERLSHELERWSRLDPSERRERGEHAWRYGSARFGVDASVDRLEQLLLDAIGRHRSPVAERSTRLRRRGFAKAA